MDSVYNLLCVHIINPRIFPKLKTELNFMEVLILKYVVN